MFYRIIFICFLIYVAVPARAQEDPVRYRVELIVLRHLDSNAEPKLEPSLEDFSDAMDIVPPPPGEAEEGVTEAGENATGAEAARGQADEAMAGSGAMPAARPANATAADPGPSAMPSDGASTGLFPLEELPPPPSAVWIETPGETMQEAWRRMRLSAGFRPELYFSWEQPDTAPFPRIRIHDDRLIYVDDPSGDLHEGAEDLDAASLSGAFDETGEDASADETEIDVPAPVRYYALDGTARLRRSRFLHLELDLVWREPVAMIADVAGPALPPESADESDRGRDHGQQALAPVAVEGDPLATPPDAVRVHRLRQSRPVQTGEVEYFDGPFMGVLAVITRIEPTPETSAEPTMETSPAVDARP